MNGFTRLVNQSLVYLRGRGFLAVAIGGSSLLSGHYLVFAARTCQLYERGCAGETESKAIRN